MSEQMKDLKLTPVLSVVRRLSKSGKEYYVCEVSAGDFRKDVFLDGLGKAYLLNNVSGVLYRDEASA